MGGIDRNGLAAGRSRITDATTPGSRERDMRNWMRGALAGVSAIAVVAASGLTLAYAQNGPKPSPQAAPTAAPAPTVRGGRPDKVADGATEVIAEMRDGVKLAGDLYKPEGAGPFPWIVQ